MTPPSFNDLGKSSKDLFNKGYAHGFLKFDSTTKAVAEPLGNLEVKYKIPQYGSVITEKWNTDNTLGTAIEIKDQLAKGLKVTLDTTYVPHTAKRGAVMKTEWSGDMLKINADMTLSYGPVLTLSSVWATTNDLKTTSVACGYDSPEYTVHAYTNDGNEFGGSTYHKVHKNVELGAQLGWTVGDQGTRFALASKYRVNNDLILRAKVDNKSQVAVSATHDLSSGVKITFSTLFGLVNGTDANNKFGIGVEYTP
uniref:Voltage-dependent anion-selective channel n=1 Tax=Ditylenchus dipsaci TaxID=166011 RepID=A0A915E735_9BILA